VIVEPLRAGHVDRFVPGATAIGSWTPENVVSLRTDWLGKAAVSDGERVLALFGIGLENGSGYVWLLLDDAARTRPLLLTRWAIRTLAARRRQYGIRSFTAQTFDADSARWARFLGVETMNGNEMVMSDGS